MMIKAIETEYKGYRFRSRLEARWAVFFDAIGAKWEYEPEGFELKDGTLYLPDFRLKGVKGRGVHDDKGEIYVEVKGVLGADDLHKIEMFPMPIIIFGQIPDAEWKEGRWSDGEPYAYWSFDFGKDNNENFYNLQFSEGDDYWTEPKACKGGGLALDYPDNPYDFVDDDLTAEAYKKARQARFEHGEHGVKQELINKQINSRELEKQRALQTLRMLETGARSETGETKDIMTMTIRRRLCAYELEEQIEKIMDEINHEHDTDMKGLLLESYFQKKAELQSIT